MIGYIQSPGNFNEALAFAYYHRIAPIFHENIFRENFDKDPFEDVYVVKADFVDGVLKYVDEQERMGNLEAIAFGNLEDKFGGYKANRMELLYALEYTRITGRFHDAVWKAIEHNAPLEASSVDSTFPPEAVTFY
ncbi:hypothetical protein [Burkholderia gladioli]|uniref:hypothetical protein n=1 Tax=Burkholderia gladioli TaxID=28095 RepID=UPI001FC8A8AB|nr:hypothetical protein [Burkholderia gladioli]